MAHSQLRVLHFIARLDPSYGGPSRSVPQQIQSVIKAGIPVDVITEAGRDGFTEEVHELQRTGGKVFSVPRLGAVEMFGLSGGSARALLRSRVSKYSIIHVNGIWTPICHLGCVLAKELGKPLVISPHGMMEPWSIRQKWLKKRIALGIYQRSDFNSASLLRATAQSEANQFKKLGLKAPVAVIPNGTIIPKQVRRRRPASSKVALFMSRIHPKKGLLDLVHAVSSLKSQILKAKWRFVIAGYDEAGYLAKVQLAAIRSGVDELFEFRGPAEGDEKWKLYHSSHLFVLPSRSENFGVVIAEALASGLPVITTQGGPWSEIRETRSGWWIPADVQSLTSALRAAISTPDETLDAMGGRGRTLVRERYSWPAIGRQFVEIYSWLAGLKERPPFVHFSSTQVP